jgi:hypothetical protein
VDSLVLAKLQGLRAAGAYKDRKSYTQGDSFVKFFDDTYRWRRPFLLIIGGTNLGKIMLAGKILEELAKRSGIENYALEVNSGGGAAGAEFTWSSAGRAGRGVAGRGGLGRDGAGRTWARRNGIGWGERAERGGAGRG